MTAAGGSPAPLLPLAADPPPEGAPGPPLVKVTDKGGRDLPGGLHGPSVLAPEPAPIPGQLDSLERFDEDPWYVSRSTTYCLAGSRSIVRWSSETGEVVIQRFRCQSWRCPWCGPVVGRRDFARLAVALDGGDRGYVPGAAWLLLTLTFDPRRHRTPWDAYSASYGAWRALKDRLRYRFGQGRRGRAPMDDVAVYERHRSGWPHAHLVVRMPGLRQEVEALGPWSERPYRLDRNGNRVTIWTWEREVFRPMATASGFGEITDVQTTYDDRGIAGYFAKLASELGGGGKKAYQLPVDAPAGFRRMRSSRGLVPPIRTRNTEWTGKMVKGPAEDVAADWLAGRVALC